MGRSGAWVAAATAEVWVPERAELKTTPTTCSASAAARLNPSRNEAGGGCEVVGKRSWEANIL